MLIQPASSQPGHVKGTFALLENSISLQVRCAARWLAWSNGTLRRSMAPETHTVKRSLHSPFTDCVPGTVIQRGGNLS
ncbi:hypothetical protein TNCV_3170231 [Trichonephila clavipes]|nr:hypothetical protein TNCV_3170231 [Trichonephila clavipes]